MQTNRVKKIIREGGLALGTYVGGIADPQIVEIIGHAGFEFLAPFDQGHGFSYLKRNPPCSAMKSMANDVPGPIAWSVVWGRSVTTSFVTEVVEAYDAQEAMVEGSRRHPELLRPNFALPIDPSHKTYGD